MHAPLSLLFLYSRNNKLALLAENWKVYSGVVSLDDLPEPHRVERILLSESYNSQTYDHDVALLKLVSPVVFDSQSEPRYSQISVNTHVPSSRGADCKLFIKRFFSNSSVTYVQMKRQRCAAGRSRRRTDAEHDLVFPAVEPQL